MKKRGKERKTKERVRLGEGRSGRRTRGRWEGVREREIRKGCREEGGEKIRRERDREAERERLEEGVEEKDGCARGGRGGVHGGGGWWGAGTVYREFFFERPLDLGSTRDTNHA